MHRSALPGKQKSKPFKGVPNATNHRSEEHTSELQSRLHLVCRLLLEKKKKKPPSSQTSNRIHGNKAQLPEHVRARPHGSHGSALCVARYLDCDIPTDVFNVTHVSAARCE